MGYTTDFKGQFDLDKKLDPETHELLRRLSVTRRMKRNVDAKYGVDGEFYAESLDDCGQNREDNIVDYNTPPGTQPSLWCQWTPTEDGLHIEWDLGEKFYAYVEWLEYIIEKILAPRGYVLSGEVRWRGEDFDDTGKIVVKKNKVTTKQMR